MRLIDADRLQRPIYASDDNIIGIGMLPEEIDAYNEGINEAWRRIENAPAIDAEPVKHAYWKTAGGFVCCSNCGCDPDFWEPKPNNPSGLPKWCFGCGARMDVCSNEE